MKFPVSHFKFPGDNVPVFASPRKKVTLKNEFNSLKSGIAVCLKKHVVDIIDQKVEGSASF